MKKTNADSDSGVAPKLGTGGSPVCARQKQGSDGVTAILTSLKRLAGRQTQPARCRRSPILRFVLVPIMIALVLFLPVARGAILERLKNGENLTVAAIGTSLTATDWGFWFQPTSDWLNGQGFPGKVTLANRAVCGSASKLVPGTADYRDGVSQLADVLAKDNPDAVFHAAGAKGIIVPSVQQALQSQVTAKTTGSAGQAAPVAATAVNGPCFKENSRILFQGDSITDGERNRNDCPHLLLGQGYQFIIAARFSALHPERKVTFINRAVSGNNVNMMAARWQTDTLDQKPDLLSVLIGINDSGIGGGDERKVPLDQYEQVYDKLLADARAANPNIRLVLGDPFYLPKEGRKECDARDQDLRQWQAIVAKLATKYQAALVKYQKVFDDACKRAPAGFWAADGVHPTYSGHQLMADEWVRTVTQFFK